MDLTKIFTGMDKGPEAIQANFDKLNGATGGGTEWSKAGLTPLNGFGGTNLCWRKYEINGLKVLEFSGWCKTVHLEGNTSADIIQVSDEVKNMFGIYFAQASSIDSSPASGLSFDTSNGRIKMTNGNAFAIEPFETSMSLVIIG